MRLGRADVVAQTLSVAEVVVRSLSCGLVCWTGARCLPCCVCVLTCHCHSCFVVLLRSGLVDDWRVVFAGNPPILGIIGVTPNGCFRLVFTDCH